MMILGKVHTEKLVLKSDVPEVNMLVADACMIPLLQSKNALNYFSQYVAPANVKNTAYQMFFKSIVFGKPNHAIEMSFSGTYKPTTFLDEKIPSTVYFDGTYVNSGMDFEKFDHVFSFFRDEAERERINTAAKEMNVKVDEMFYIDYGSLLKTENRYTHGTKWLAATIGATFAKTVLVPMTNDFWSLERSNAILMPGGDWISRYYGDVISIANPVRRDKVSILEGLKKPEAWMFPCKCGVCMECITTSMVVGDKVAFEEDPRRSEKNLRFIRTAVDRNKPLAKIYEKFLK